MSLSHLEIHTILHEIEWLQGCLLREVYQPTTTDLILSLRTEQGNNLLLLSIDPKFSRLHLLEHRPPNPRKPHPFQMLCRKTLHGRLVSLKQVPGDRVVHLTFEGDSRATLVVELTGRYGNIFILDQAQRILGSLKRPRTDKRSLVVGAPYIPPPPPPNPVMPKDRFASRPDGMTYQEAVARHYAEEIDREARESLRSRLLTAARRELKRLDRRRAALESDLGRAEQAETFRRYADVLQIYLGKVPRGRDFVILPDPFNDDQPLEIPLDPELDTLGNMRKHYRRYKKYDASIPFVLERMEEVENRSRALLSAIPQLETALTTESLLQLEKRYRVGLAAKKRRARQTTPTLKRERTPHIRYVGSSGREIWVGKGARDNERLTFRLARGNDFWLHVLGRPGAHVVVPCRPHPPDLATLLEAATLAVKHSGGATGDTAEVCYTRVKHVRKLTGGQPGQVTFSQEKSLRVTLDPTRLGRLTRYNDQEDGEN